MAEWYQGQCGLIVEEEQHSRHKEVEGGPTSHRLLDGM